MTTGGATGSGGSDGMPVGREEVVAATLSNAADLFAERGPAATSIRDVAARAGVNHGLVFRHFGTKEQLVGAVLDYLGLELAALLESGATAEAIEAGIERHWRVMARAILDGFDVGQLQQRFPTMSRMLEQTLPRYDSDFGARMAVANTVALQLGWRLFEPFIRSAVGIEQVPEMEVRNAINAEMARMVEPAEVAGKKPNTPGGSAI